MKHLVRQATHRAFRPCPRAVFDASVLKLVRALRDLRESEECIGTSCYRQSPMLRLVVLEVAEKLEAAFQGGVK